MAHTLTYPGLDFPFDDLIDVRSPAEFAEDHLPGAINLPALSNDERAMIGTIFVRDSPFKARRLGAALVSRNIAAHLDGPLARKPKGWKPLVYCWRGGQRSGSVVTVLRQIGWQAETLEGGYRAYRRSVNEYLYEQAFPSALVLLSGNTGTAKTAILQALAGAGVQTIDLEGLARHRGSLFGGLEVGQPSQKAFESALAAQISSLSLDRPVVIEAESNKIGARTIPPMLWAAMKAAPRIEVEAPLRARAKFTLETYNDIAGDTDRLVEILEGLRAFHSADQIEDWQAMVASGNLVELTKGLMANHYDPRYRKSKGRHQRDTKILGTLNLPGLGPTDIADAVRTIKDLLD